jgi:KDO2-lipid IV(A) lauroyltransferase
MEYQFEFIKKIFESFALSAIRFLVRTLGLLSLKTGRRVGGMIGRMLFILDKRHRDVAVDNLTHAFGCEKSRDEIETIARKVFENLGKVLFETCWALNRDGEELFRHFKIKNRSNIQDAYNKGRGVLALTGHFGNWELTSVIGRIVGYPLNVVYRPLDFDPLNRFLAEARTRFGASLIHRRRAVRKILRAIYQGGLVSILLDQSVDWYEGVFVDFFGRLACTNQGMALVAMKTQAPVVPAFLVRDPDGFTAYFFPEVPLSKTGDKIKDVETNTERYNQAIEWMIRQHPDQWFWVHRRWKVQPYHPWPGNSGVPN